MAASYSLILSKGTHLVDESTRRRVLVAIEQGDRVVEIPVDRYHDGSTTTATIVTAHVVAFFAHEALDDVELPSNVTPLSRRA
jgi:fibronectin type 3 domain-containing protein